MNGIVDVILNVLKNLHIYVLGLVRDHTILFLIAAAIFIFIAFFSNKAANKLRTFYVLASLLLIVFAFISQSWSRITLIVLSLILLGIFRLIGFIISEIRITRKNKRIEERALEKAAKRRGNWQNKQGYSGARKMIVEPEYIPGKMNQEEIEDVIENELSDKKPGVDEIPEAAQENQKETEKQKN